jgi:hypothetical protein
MPYAMEFPHFDAFFGRTSDLKIFLLAGCPRAGSAATPTFRARPCPAKRHGRIELHAFSSQGIQPPVEPLVSRGRRR